MLVLDREPESGDQSFVTGACRVNPCCNMRHVWRKHQTPERMWTSGSLRAAAKGDAPRDGHFSCDVNRSECGTRRHPRAPTHGQAEGVVTSLRSTRRQRRTRGNINWRYAHRSCKAQRIGQLLYGMQLCIISASENGPQKMRRNCPILQIQTQAPC